MCPRSIVSIGEARIEDRQPSSRDVKPNYYTITLCCPSNKPKHTIFSTRTSSSCFLQAPSSWVRISSYRLSYSLVNTSVIITKDKSLGHGARVTFSSLRVSMGFSLGIKALPLNKREKQTQCCYLIVG